MEIQYYLKDWTKERAFWFAGLLLIVLLVIFTYLNIGVGPPVEILGKVTSVGLNTATRYELTHPLVSIELEDRSIITIDTPKEIPLATGDDIVVLKSSRSITQGAEYQFHRKIE
jgi:hypothetical protein